jgi:hypothetical protein
VLSVGVAGPQAGGAEDVEALIGVAASFEEVTDIGHLGSVKTGLLPQFAARHLQRVGSLYLLFPGTLGKFPIAALHRIAELLDEVQATIIFDRNDHHKIRLLYYAINSIGPVRRRIVSSRTRIHLVD